MSGFDCSLLEEQHFQTSDSLKDGAISCSDWSRFAIASSTGFTLLTFSGHSSRKVQLFTVSWFQLDQHLEQDDLRYYTYTPLALFCPDSLRPDGARLLAVASSTGQLVICDANQESPVVLFNVSKRWRSQLDERNGGTGANPSNSRKPPTSNGTTSTGGGLSRDEEALLGKNKIKIKTSRFILRTDECLEKKKIEEKILISFLSRTLLFFPLRKTFSKKIDSCLFFLLVSKRKGKK
jgi:hypothetical protein